MVKLYQYDSLRIINNEADILHLNLNIVAFFYSEISFERRPRFVGSPLRGVLSY